VRDSGLRAEITVPPHFDASMLTPELCQMTLLGADVVVNQQAEQLIRDGIDRYDPSANEPHSIEIPAQRPQHGEDGWFDWDERFDPTVTHQVDDSKDGPKSANSDTTDEPVDYYNRSRYVMVETGDVLGRRVPPTYGEDGVDVRGKILPAKPGREVRHTLDDSILIDGKGQYVAQTTGLLRVEGERISISPVLEVNQDVDFGTGNIDFDGDVEITKGVRDCFRVKCTGDLMTRGLVEAATIVVGGDYEAAGGMASKEKGRLEVRGSMTARYLDNVEGFVKRDLTLQREMINCRIAVGGELSIPAGALIGGCVRVLGQVHLAALGSASGMNLTELHLGSEPQIEDLLHSVNAVLDKTRAERDETQGKLTALTDAKAGSTSSQREELTVLMCEVSILDEQIASLERRAKKLGTYFELMRDVRLTVEKMIHPKTLLVIGDKQVMFRDAAKGPLTIRRKSNGEVIVEHANSQQQRPVGSIAEVSLREPSKTAA